MTSNGPEPMTSCRSNGSTPPRRPRIGGPYRLDRVQEGEAAECPHLPSAQRTHHPTRQPCAGSSLSPTPSDGRRGPSCPRSDSGPGPGRRLWPQGGLVVGLGPACELLAVDRQCLFPACCLDQAPQSGRIQGLARVPGPPLVRAAQRLVTLRGAGGHLLRFCRPGHGGLPYGCRGRSRLRGRPGRDAFLGGRGRSSALGRRRYERADTRPVERVSMASPAVSRCAGSSSTSWSNRSWRGRERTRRRWSSAR